MEQNVFITEVGIPQPGPPGPVLPTPAPVTREAPQQNLVRNIYDFPSVQNLKVENGTNLPFRYRIRPSGRMPTFHMYQGKRIGAQGVNMAKHHTIFAGPPSQIAETAARAVRKKEEGPMFLPRVTAGVHQPPTLDKRKAIEQQLQTEHQAAQPRCAASFEQARNDAAYNKEFQSSHSTSVVGSLTAPPRKARGSRLPSKTSSGPAPSDDTASDFTATTQQPAYPAVSSSVVLQLRHAKRGSFEDQAGSPAGQSAAPLSKATMASVKSRGGVHIPCRPPPSDAPAPLPTTPQHSAFGSPSEADQYDNLTSVSMRTPQSFCSSRPMAPSRGLEHLARNLQLEQASKRKVEAELLQLKRRQQALISALSPTERHQLESRLKSAGIE
ncbi:hypothetical protein DIPPA_10087 [Diplonema papillatum]|nr:hypothetical protein DIPPA_10087 [Diplonema papillatum]